LVSQRSGRYDLPAPERKKTVRITQKVDPFTAAQGNKSRHKARTLSKLKFQISGKVPLDQELL